MNTTPKSLIQLLVITVLTFSMQNTAAQQATNESIIRGLVADSATGKPVTSATVYLLDDSARVVAQAISKEDGSFAFSAAPAKLYAISISAVGYQQSKVGVQIDGQVQVNPKIYYLIKSVSVLNEVVVKAARPLVRQEMDKVIYDMQADPKSKGNSLLEMMRKVPFLSLDADENVLLNGSSGYKVLINGRPSGMIERNPKEILRSIPASTIKSIEVITNPPSKYDAEGVAGIINIITIKKTVNGYNGSVNLNYKSPVGGPGTGASIAFKQGRFGFSALGGANLYKAPQTQSSISRTTWGGAQTYLDQSIKNRSDGGNSYFGAELSYEVDSLNLISAQVNLGESGSNGLTGQQTKISTQSSIFQQYFVNNNARNDGGSMDLAVNYQLGFKQSKERLLTFSYRYMKYTNRQFAELDVLNLLNFSEPDYQQRNTGEASEHTSQLDYVHKKGKVAIEAGLKGIARSNKSAFQYHVFDSSNKKFELVASRSDIFNNAQNIFSVYNTYQYNVQEWGFKAGLRLEQTLVDADFVSSNAHVAQQYLSVIPAASINRKLSNGSGINFNYTRRILRPSIQHLNPFVDRSNPSFESSGNPYLKPAFTNVIQLSYNKTKKGTFNVALGYMHFSNMIGPVLTYDAARQITRRTYESIGRARIVKTNIYVNHPIGKNWSMQLNSDIRHVASELPVNKMIVLNKGWTANVNVSGTWRLNEWRVNADVTLNSGGISSVQSKSNSFVNSALGIQHDFLKEQLTVSVGAKNPFTQFRRNREQLFGLNFYQVNISEVYYRSFSVSLNYRFGKLENAIKKSRRGINNDDMVLK